MKKYLLAAVAALALVAAPAHAADRAAELIKKWTVVDGTCRRVELNLDPACLNRVKFERALRALGYCLDGPNTPVANWHKGPVVRGGTIHSLSECVDNNGNE
jgi:hypothetical protein